MIHIVYSKYILFIRAVYSVDTAWIPWGPPGYTPAYPAGPIVYSPGVAANVYMPIKNHKIDRQKNKRESENSSPHEQLKSPMNTGLDFVVTFPYNHARGNNPSTPRDYSYVHR